MSGQGMEGGEVPGPAEYASPWLDVMRSAAGRRRLRTPTGAVAVLIRDEHDERVLLSWRHRFITDSWGYEVPAGAVEPGESIDEGAARELREETGWGLADARRALTYEASPRLGSQRFDILLATARGPAVAPTDTEEAAQPVWLDHDEVRAALRAGQVSDGVTQIALLLWLRESDANPTRKAQRT